MTEAVVTTRRVYHLEDCQRLQRIALANYFELTLIQCQDIWQAYSEEWCAGWLILPKDDSEVWKYMEPLIEEVI